METLPYLSEEEQTRAKDCINNIFDKINALQTEVSNDRSYKHYMLEKLESALWDMNCLISMCKNNGDDNDG